MGCDIHGPYVYGLETGVRSDGTTWSVWGNLGVLHWGRDYCLFSYLADVRNEGWHDPVAPPRGPHAAWLNESDNYTFRGVVTSPDSDKWEHTYSPGDCHSQSWLSTDELVEVQVRYAADPHHGLGPSGDVAMALALMRTAEEFGYTDVHIGFCFDN